MAVFSLFRDDTEINKSGFKLKKTMLSTNCIIQYGSQYLHVTIIKLIKFKLNQKFISLIALATFQVFKTTCG